MNKYLKYSLIAMLVVAVLGISAVGIAYAQEDDPPRPHEALAELLGLTSDELHEKIQDGSTLDELAETAGVDLEAFWQEMREIREVEHKERLEEALQNDDITQEQYDWMIEGFEKGFMGGMGFGGRSGFGPGKGFGPFGDGEGTKPFGGQEGFGRRGFPGNRCGMEGADS